MMKRICLVLAALLVLGSAALAVESGKYAADIAVSEDWFGFTDAIVVISDAGITLQVTATTGEGETLVVGGREIAPAGSVPGEDVYTLPVEALGAPVEITWQDAEGAAHRMTLTVDPDGLTPLGAASIQDRPGAEEMEDGSYEVAEFSFCGGSGEVTISCADLRISGGQATATISFSNPYYESVEVDGVAYEGKYTDESSEFEIPVLLNADTVILGTTFALGQSHEVEYALRVVPGARRED